MASVLEEAPIVDFDKGFVKPVEEFRLVDIKLIC
jgi:hypothetical protein